VARLSSCVRTGWYRGLVDVACCDVSANITRPGSRRSALGDASHFARLVTERLLQGSSKTSPPSTSPPVSTPSIHVRHAAGPRVRAAVGHCCHRADSWSLRPPAAMRATRSDFAVSHRLAGLLHRRLTGLLHPVANHGVHRVSARGPIANRCRVLSRRCPALQSLPRFHSRADVTVDRCPLDIAGCAPSRGTCCLQGLAPWERPLSSTAVASV